MTAEGETEMAAFIASGSGDGGTSSASSGSSGGC